LFFFIFYKNGEENMAHIEFSWIFLLFFFLKMQATFAHALTLIQEPKHPKVIWAQLQRSIQTLDDVCQFVDCMLNHDSFRRIEDRSTLIAPICLYYETDKYTLSQAIFKTCKAYTDQGRENWRYARASCVFDAAITFGVFSAEQLLVFESYHALVDSNALLPELAELAAEYVDPWTAMLLTDDEFVPCKSNKKQKIK